MFLPIIFTLALLIKSANSLDFNFPENVDSESVSQTLFPSNLRTDDFDKLVYNPDLAKVISNDQAWFIKFYTPWCKHCQAIAPVWDALYEYFQKSQHEKVNVANVDCGDDQSLELCVQFRVQGYPTLLFLKDDMFYKFRGNRDFESLVHFALKNYTNAEI